ncbi:MAG: DNA mismatch repair protein MutS [Bacteroidota bacterium]
MSTPLMKQYAQVKARYPGAILLFRMGDFYETFDEDARVAARVLGITLTRRGNGAAGEVPLAGFPHHALESYLPRLLKAGHRVAVCEQTEDPRFARGLVKREVIEVVTPGVAYSEKVLDGRRNNYLAAAALPSAVASASDTVGFAWADVSTAEFRVTEFPLARLREQAASIQSAEILVQRRDAAAVQRLLEGIPCGLFTLLEDWIFHEEAARELLLAHFQTRSLKGFGMEDMGPGTAAAGAILHYLQETQKANLLHIRRISRVDTGETMTLDPSTKRNLEIGSTLSGESEGSLFSVLDRTRTPMGGRLLNRWVHQPLRRAAGITARLDAVEELKGKQDVRSRVQEVLERIGDLERLMTRVCTGRANPREMLALKSVLEDVAAAAGATADLTAALPAELHGRLHPLPHLVKLIGEAMADDPPATLAEGGVIRTGYSRELDGLRESARGGKTWIAELQRKERERTGIPSLKVGFNNVFGYYIEITHTHRERIPPDYIRKQTLTGAERYVTPELKEEEERILHAEERIAALEAELYNGLRLSAGAEAEAVQENAAALATLDCLASLAEDAQEYGYVRPEVDEGTVLEIEDGRHPVIERFLPPGQTYTPNSLRLDTSREQVVILTGPNMSGKSSYLRQAGLITLLAQVGSFVSAARARVGLVDNIFTRVGASDNITSGESTFLVEMHEAAHILNTATSRSLILLDEVGRGTSTFDGISIAWALTEYIHQRLGARTLFATHYHELNELADRLPRVRNFKVEVREYGETVIFLHRVSPGFADHSYGIHVARMAGLPREVTDRAQEILGNLEGSGLTLQEAGARTGGRTGLQLTLFEPGEQKLRAELEAMDIERMTPLEALAKLAELKKLPRG